MSAPFSRAGAMESGLSIWLGLAFGLVGIFISTTPITIGTIAPPMPWLALIPVVFWAGMRPGARATMATFALGLAQDIGTGAPLGVWAFAFLAAYVAVAFARYDSAARGWVAGWTALAIAAVTAGIAASLAGGIAAGSPAHIGALIAQAISTILVAPLFALPLGGLGRLTHVKGSWV